MSHSSTKTLLVESVSSEAEKKRYDYANWPVGLFGETPEKARENFQLVLKAVRTVKKVERQLPSFPWYADFCQPPRFLGGKNGLELEPTSYVPSLIVLELCECIVGLAMYWQDQYTNALEAFIKKTRTLLEVETQKADASVARLQGQTTFKKGKNKKARKKQIKNRRKQQIRTKAQLEKLEKRLEEGREMIQVVERTLETEQARAVREYTDMYVSLTAIDGFSENSGLRTARCNGASITLGNYILAAELYFHKTAAICDYLKTGAIETKQRLPLSWLQIEGIQSPYYTIMRREAAQPLTVDFRVIPYNRIPKQSREAGIELATRVQAYLIANNKMAEDRAKNPPKTPEEALYVPSFDSMTLEEAKALVKNDKFPMPQGTYFQDGEVHFKKEEIEKLKQAEENYEEFDVPSEDEDYNDGEEQHGDEKTPIDPIDIMEKRPKPPVDLDDLAERHELDQEFKEKFSGPIQKSHFEEQKQPDDDYVQVREGASFDEKISAHI